MIFKIKDSITEIYKWMTARNWNRVQKVGNASKIRGAKLESSPKFWNRSPKNWNRSPKFWKRLYIQKIRFLRLQAHARKKRTRPIPLTLKMNLNLQMKIPLTLKGNLILKIPLTLKVKIPLTLNPLQPSQHCLRYQRLKFNPLQNPNLVL